MVGIDNSVSSYSAVKDSKTGAIKISYDDKNIHDEEKVYEFNSDGSANATSSAWGTKTSLPPGTFSDIIAKLPNTDTLNAELAKNMAQTYEQIYQANKNK